MHILAAALLIASPVPPELGPAWAEFSRGDWGHGTHTEVEVGTLGFDKSRARLDFWLRRTVGGGVGRQEEVTWTETRTCGSARPLLASMRHIPVPKFAPIGSSKGPPIIVDGMSYALRTYSDDGMLSENTNLGTPLAAWIDGALATLEKCWSSRVPERTR
jgi:hypothetical protein